MEDCITKCMRGSEKVPETLIFRDTLGKCVEMAPKRTSLAGALANSTRHRP